MQQMGALDFAGGAVVHMSSGSAALVVAIMLGRRKGYGHTPFIPHNLPMTVLGAGILWFGWFGFNAGSALAANEVAANAFVTTHMATAAASLVWILVEWLHGGKPTTLGAASGAVAGLVAITPGAGFVPPGAALVIGAAAGLVCFGGILLKNKFKYDDALDVVGVHGVGGTWGAIATGIFATVAVNSAGADGLLLAVHPDPPRALSDGRQSLTVAEFRLLVEEVEAVAWAVGRDLHRPRAARPETVRQEPRASGWGA
jgi:Amt family ammonium transporter